MTYIDVVARAVARERGRAVVIRERSGLAPEPPAQLVYGFAPVKMVSEELLMAVAFGTLDAAPQIITRWNPLSRESGDLEPLAESLAGYLADCQEAEYLPRIWMPNPAARYQFELLGHRYRTNKAASEALQRMGKQCRALAEESRVPGQQVVAVASEVLATHVATGQSPAADGHLGALMAWVRPVPGVDPAEEAARRALTPAAAMLSREDDDRVEALRRIARGHGRAAERARAEIHTVLAAGAQAEWDGLMEARDAFLELGLAADHLDALVKTSADRLDFTLQTFPGPLVSPHALARELEHHERGMELVDKAALADFAMRERTRRRGGVFEATVVSRDPAVPTRNGFELVLHTEQETLRAREGSDLRLLDGKVTGRVLEVSGDERGGFRLRLRADGVRSRGEVDVGCCGEWADAGPVDMSYVRGKSRKHVQQRAPFLAYGDELPAPNPRQLPEGSQLLRRAEELRR